jgi:hypothetical protein
VNIFEKIDVFIYPIVTFFTGWESRWKYITEKHKFHQNILEKSQKSKAIVRFWMILADFEMSEFPKITKDLQITLGFWDFSKNSSIVRFLRPNIWKFAGRIISYQYNLILKVFMNTKSEIFIMDFVFTSNIPQKSQTIKEQ